MPSLGKCSPLDFTSTRKLARSRRIIFLASYFTIVCHGRIATWVVIEITWLIARTSLMHSRFLLVCLSPVRW